MSIFKCFHPFLYLRRDCKALYSSEFTYRIIFWDGIEQFPLCLHTFALYSNLVFQCSLPVCKLSLIIFACTLSAKSSWKLHTIHIFIKIPQFHGIIYRSEYYQFVTAQWRILACYNTCFLYLRGCVVNYTLWFLKMFDKLVLPLYFI